MFIEEKYVLCRSVKDLSTSIRIMSKHDIIMFNDSNIDIHFIAYCGPCTDTLYASCDSITSTNEFHFVYENGELREIKNIAHCLSFRE